MVRAAVNVVASVVLCVAAVGVGHLVAAHLNGSGVRAARIGIDEES